MTLGSRYGSRIQYSIIICIFYLHGRRVRIRATPLFFAHAGSFDISVLKARLHEDLQILRLKMRLEIEPSLLRP